MNSLQHPPTPNAYHKRPGQNHFFARATKCHTATPMQTFEPPKHRAQGPRRLRLDASSETPEVLRCMVGTIRSRATVPLAHAPSSLAYKAWLRVRVQTLCHTVQPNSPSLSSIQQWITKFVTLEYIIIPLYLHSEILRDQNEGLRVRFHVARSDRLVAMLVTIEKASLCVNAHFGTTHPFGKETTSDPPTLSRSMWKPTLPPWLQTSHSPAADLKIP